MRRFGHNRDKSGLQKFTSRKALQQDWFKTRIKSFLNRPAASFCLYSKLLPALEISTSLFAQVKADHGRLDTIVVNAGGGTMLPLGQIIEEQVDDTLGGRRSPQVDAVEGGVTRKERQAMVALPPKKKRAQPDGERPNPLGYDCGGGQRVVGKNVARGGSNWQAGHERKWNEHSWRPVSCTGYLQHAHSISFRVNSTFGLGPELCGAARQRLVGGV